MTGLDVGLLVGMVVALVGCLYMAWKTGEWR